MDNSSLTFTPENVSKYWNILNNSNNPNDKRISNDFLIQFKKDYNKCLQISFQLFKSQSLDDKLISSLLIYQCLNENPKILSNEKDFNQIKSYILDNILITYTNEKEIEKQDNIVKSKASLIIERICYAMSIIVLIGTFSFWPNAIDDMLLFGKTTLKHTYLITIIFGNCNNELKALLLNNKDESFIRNKFTEKKEEFNNFINTILINKNNIDKKLYDKTIYLAKNIASFKINILHIPDLIKIILGDINESNIDSLTKLFCDCINFSESKKLEETFESLDISEFDELVEKEELISYSYIIDIIVSYIQTNANNLEDEIVLGLAQIFSNLTENFIYMFFKKDSLSQKIFSLFFFFITYKTRKISQLLFETVSTMKRYINNKYKFSNYSEEEKIQFLNFMIKILFNITNKCTLKTIPKKQEVFLEEECIIIKNDNEEINNNNNYNIIINAKEDENSEDDINEISINDYRKVAQGVFINIFEIFASNYGNEGVTYFFTEITKDILPLLQKPINELNEKNILSIEVVIYIINHIPEQFEFLNLEKTPLNQLVLIFTRSQIGLNNFILVNVLLFIKEAKYYFAYNKQFFSELIIFLLNLFSLRINKTNESSEEINKLISFVLRMICQSYDEGFIPEIWDKIFEVYSYYYDKCNFFISTNFSEALGSLFLIYTNNKKEELPKEMKLIYFKKVAEVPILRIEKIGEIMLSKDNKNKEQMIRFEIIKNLNLFFSVLKQCSYSSDKIYINTIFNDIYNKTYQQLSTIIYQYNKDSEVINAFMNIFNKVSGYLNTETLNSVYKNLNEMMINSFCLNTDNYQCIDFLRNIYQLKLKNINEKNSSNKEYLEIYNNFMKLIREICSGIIKSTNYKIELMISLSSFFSSIFSQLNKINKEDYTIISDAIILFNEGIKTIREDNLINNIIDSFKVIVESPNLDLIKDKLIEIIKNVFLSLDHFNLSASRPLSKLCVSCIKFDKIVFMKTFNNILNTPDFDCFNNNHKLFLYNYFDHFSDNSLKIKILLDRIIQIIQKKITDSVDDILEHYNKTLLESINYKKSEKSATYF